MFEVKSGSKTMSETPKKLENLLAHSKAGSRNAAKCNRGAAKVQQKCSKSLVKVKQNCSRRVANVPQT